MNVPSIRVQLYIGSGALQKAPAEVVDALVSLEITSNDRERDGFQMSFTLGKDQRKEYNLLLQRYFDPPNLMSVVIIVGATRQVLIDGIITNHQINPGQQAGQATLSVTGEDVSLLMDLVEKRIDHPNQADSTIVSSLIGAYDLTPDVTSTDDTPHETQRLPLQQGSDLAYIQQLAQRNGFVFHVKPGEAPGESVAYWGPDVPPQGKPQPALTANMGPHTNVESLSFSFDALKPVEPQVAIQESNKDTPTPISPISSTRQRLVAQPARPLRRTLPPSTAGLTSGRASARGAAEIARSVDAVNVSGELNVLRYGRVLRARSLVDLRGVGQSYGGTYYVKQVTHSLRKGQYTQRFTLLREGHGSLSGTVTIG